jgi:hypothetical protein
MSEFGVNIHIAFPSPTVRIGEAEPSPIWTGKACQRLCSWQSVPRRFPAHCRPGRLNSIGSRKGQYSGNSDLVWHPVPLWDVTRCPSFPLVSTCGTRVLPTVPRLCVRVMMLKTAAQLPLTALWAIIGARNFLLSAFFLQYKPLFHGLAGWAVPIAPDFSGRLPKMFRRQWSRALPSPCHPQKRVANADLCAGVGHSTWPGPRQGKASSPTGIKL